MARRRPPQRLGPRFLNHGRKRVHPHCGDEMQGGAHAGRTRTQRTHAAPAAPKLSTGWHERQYKPTDATQMRQHANAPRAK
eukprot:11180541-Lingulodinium_polyedra.AAC.1